MSKICCLTPTGDRHDSLALSKLYFERAKAHYLTKEVTEIEWVVVDDGVTPFNPGGCTYLKRAPDGPNSLGRNLQCGLKAALEAEFILIWEDDDWYAPTRILNQVKQLNRYPIHGYSQSVYYNVAMQGVFQHENHSHSSLFETAMTRESAQMLDALITKHIDQPFLDLLLWKAVKGKLTPHCGEAIGIKGAKGRPGLGSGHTSDKLKYTPAKLEDYIGGDSKNYEDKVSERHDFDRAACLLQTGREASEGQQLVAPNLLPCMWV